MGGISLLAESCIWISICLAIVLARLISRALLFHSFRNLQADDWVMLLTLLLHLAFIATIIPVSRYRSNLLQPDVDVLAFSVQEMADRIFGSKLTIVVEQLQCLTIWLTKACLVILFYRVTKGLISNIAVIMLGLYLAISYLITILLYFLVWCRPFHNYWALPTPTPEQCSATKNHLIIFTAFNMTGNVAIIVFAFSLFIVNRLPWHRKLILSFIFGLGLFSILSAILSKYYSFTRPYGNQWTFWYVRESSTALIVANVPFTWTILRRLFHLKSFEGHSEIGSHSQYPDARMAYSRGGANTSKLSFMQSHTSSDRRSSMIPWPYNSLVNNTDEGNSRNLQAGNLETKTLDALARQVLVNLSSGSPSARASCVCLDDLANCYPIMTVLSPTDLGLPMKQSQDEENQVETQQEATPTYHDFLKMLYDDQEQREVTSFAN